MLACAITNREDRGWMYAMRKSFGIVDVLIAFLKRDETLDSIFAMAQYDIIQKLDNIEKQKSNDKPTGKTEEKAKPKEGGKEEEKAKPKEGGKCAPDSVNDEVKSKQQQPQHQEQGEGCDSTSN